ncbi:MAG: DUF4920 domain-containing protein [Myxococcota bacterium]|nr:DUF4920 domain-containing protein [Myxococcota bacterium]
MRVYQAGVLVLLVGCAAKSTSVESEEPTAAAPGVGDELATDGVDAEGWMNFGGEFSVDEVLTAGELLANPAEYLGSQVRVSARVTDVCQKSGCWMVIEDQGQTMRVLMKEHGFAVDMKAAGSDCEVEGTVTERILDPEFVTHLEEESANTEAMPEKQAQDGRTFEIEATAVRTRSGA